MRLSLALLYLPFDLPHSFALKLRTIDQICSSSSKNQEQKIFSMKKGSNLTQSGVF